MQKRVLVGRQLPRDLRAQESFREVDFDGAQAAQAFERRVQLADELFVVLD
jgi:hypothetical protein